MQRKIEKNCNNDDIMYCIANSEDREKGEANSEWMKKDK